MYRQFKDTFFEIPFGSVPILKYIRTFLSDGFVLVEKKIKNQKRLIFNLCYSK
jgi:hypothetical protein